MSKLKFAIKYTFFKISASEYIRDRIFVVQVKSCISFSEINKIETSQNVIYDGKSRQTSHTFPIKASKFVAMDIY
jgi:hypothetical protein